MAMPDGGLWDAYRVSHDPSVRQLLVALYLPFLGFVVGRNLPPLPEGVAPDQVRDAAMCGLIEAVEGFAADRPDADFESYALPRIELALIEERMPLAWHPSGTEIKEFVDAVHRAVAVLHKILGRHAYLPELAAEMGASQDDLIRRLHVLEEAGVTALEEMLIRRYEPDAVLAAIKQLNRSERFVMALHHLERLPLREIERIFDLAASSVSLIHTMGTLQVLTILVGDDGRSGVREPLRPLPSSGSGTH
jgi:DNA-directed RNA polymerase specialized sigma subunit